MTFDGSWFARPLHRRYNRRPHFFIEGNDLCLCGNSRRGENDLLFDVETHETVEPDPGIGRPQFRRECYVCQDLLDFEPRTRDELEIVAGQESGAYELYRLYTRELRGGTRGLIGEDGESLVQSILDLQARRGMTVNEASR